ncbi:Protein of unknown function DUF4385 [Kalmanozyma brasiliensis GHG001]|uniref:Cytoplasmic protein n=1 Tax=Kalmanozyma brasiliensis (strain GHG001) TaxID=1365824 RepID=V5EVR8_KALBG|nr:Protein of unknown function DUF4385 [Kalmanozyma brasiliensis GHG001]EST09570.1 Protein of unknown function DUF4385 [Kalmanozyma brasiliensis GHG001]
MESSSSSLAPTTQRSLKPALKPSKPKSSSTSSSKFPYDLPYAHLDLRTHPHLYRTGVGEQGVLMVQPYKSELVPHWRFKTPSIATSSSSKLHSIFQTYLDEGDFVGADMARKFIQMGYTRARRYANHKGGKKYVYDDESGPKGKGSKRTEIKRLERQDQDPDKVEAARIFKQVLDEKVWTNSEYVRLREEHQEWVKGQPVLTEDCEEVKRALLKDAEKERVVRKW